MQIRAILCASLLLAAAAVAAPTPMAAAQPAAGGPGKTLAATPALVREIQFMLLTLGIDPGPIDGNARQLTNRAVHVFEARAGLPVADIANNGEISADLVDRLRQAAAQVMFKKAVPPSPPAAALAPTPPAPGAPSPPANVVAQPRVPPPDRFAACPVSPADFRIGTKQYTPQAFLDEGFDGSTTRAVTELQKRLDEARALAEHIGGAALLEVQRQARVLAYFECRLKIEQASGKS